MKKLLYLIPVILIIFSFKVEAKSYNNVGFGYFYSQLDRYGEWVEFDYGVVAFRPHIRSHNWAPYTMGRWIWTDDGWYWDSYEAFGGITYHYGRWFNDEYYGWIWIPDYDWAPAWVEWRYDNDYIGWAPLSPYAEYSISYGIRYSHPYQSPYSHWHFVDMRHFCDDHVYNRFVVGETVKYRVYNNTRTRNEYDTRNGRIINRGFDVQTIRQRGVSVRERTIERVSDVSQLRNNGSDNTKIRALVVDRNRISQGDSKQRDFTKSTRTSMELKNVQIGRDELRVKENTRNTTTETRTDTERKPVVKEQNRNNNNNRGNIETTPPVKRNDVKGNTRQNVNETERDRIIKENERTINNNRSVNTTTPVKEDRKQIQTRVNNSQNNNNRSSNTDNKRDVKVERKTETRTNVIEKRNNSGNTTQIKRETTVEKTREQNTVRKTDEKREDVKRDNQSRGNERSR